MERGRGTTGSLPPGPGRRSRCQAYAAFVLHQIVLVGLVLATREVSWPPEVDFLAVAMLGVAVSFGAGGLLARLPGVRRVI